VFYIECEMEEKRGLYGGGGGGGGGGEMPLTCTLLAPYNFAS